MQVIENLKIKEKLYIEKLQNGLTVMIIPKKDVRKKYVIWGTNYGSNDYKFVVPGENNETEVPKGVAHFLEHKLFEQENGVNSLDALTALGVNANAYTTNDHTAYLFECTDNFYEALDELMDYVQHPYFTDENVEKEKGIIGQEIMMYDDYPEWRVYLNTLEAMYHNHPVKLDITGTIESISKIDKEILYKCYNTFYNPENMVMVICGDFDPEELLKEVKKRLLPIKPNGKIKRIYPEEPESIVKPTIEQKFDVSQPVYTIGIKDTIPKEKMEKREIVKREISMQIILELLLGNSSELYQKMYKEGVIYRGIGYSYDLAKNYANILISGQSDNPERVYELIKEKIKEFKQKGINEEDFNRIKKKIYGEYIQEYNDVSSIAKMFLADYFKGVNSFDYVEEIEHINKDELLLMLKDVFKEDKMVISIVRN